MKIYDGENLESPRMEIHGGEITETKAHRWKSMMVKNGSKPIDENPWWWYNWKKGDALNKMTIGGCPKQDDGKGMS